MWYCPLTCSAVDTDLAALNVTFVLMRGRCEENIPDLVSRGGFGAIICDFSPMRIGIQWRNSVASAVDVAVFEVCGHGCAGVHGGSVALHVTFNSRYAHDSFALCMVATGRRTQHCASLGGVAEDRVRGSHYPQENPRPPADLLRGVPRSTQDGGVMERPGRGRQI